MGGWRWIFYLPLPGLGQLLQASARSHQSRLHPGEQHGGILIWRHGLDFKFLPNGASPVEARLNRFELRMSELSCGRFSWTETRSEFRYVRLFYARLA